MLKVDLREHAKLEKYLGQTLHLTGKVSHFGYRKNPGQVIDTCLQRIRTDHDEFITDHIWLPFKLGKVGQEYSFTCKVKEYIKRIEKGITVKDYRVVKLNDFSLNVPTEKFYQNPDIQMYWMELFKEHMGEYFVGTAKYNVKGEISQLRTYGMGNIVTPIKNKEYYPNNIKPGSKDKEVSCTIYKDVNKAISRSRKLNNNSKGNTKYFVFKIVPYCGYMHFGVWLGDYLPRYLSGQKVKIRKGEILSTVERIHIDKFNMIRVSKKYKKEHYKKEQSN